MIIGGWVTTIGSRRCGAGSKLAIIAGSRSGTVQTRYCWVSAVPIGQQVVAVANPIPTALGFVHPIDDAASIYFLESTMRYLSHDITTPFMAIYPRALQSCIARASTAQYPKVIAESAIDITRAAITAASDRDCRKCRHFEIDTGDDAVGMAGGGPMCLLDEGDRVVDTESFPSPAIFCPFFQVPDSELER